MRTMTGTSWAPRVVPHDRPAGDPLAKTVARAARAASDHRLSFVCGRDEHPLKTRVFARSWVPKALIPYPVEPGSLPTGLVNGELCRRVGIQPRVSNRH